MEQNIKTRKTKVTCFKTGNYIPSWHDLWAEEREETTFVSNILRFHEERSTSSRNEMITKSP